MGHVNKVNSTSSVRTTVTWVTVFAIKKITTWPCLHPLRDRVCRHRHKNVAVMCDFFLARILVWQEFWQAGSLVEKGYWKFHRRVILNDLLMKESTDLWTTSDSVPRTFVDTERCLLLCKRTIRPLPISLSGILDYLILSLLANTRTKFPSSAAAFGLPLWAHWLSFGLLSGHLGFLCDASHEVWKIS